MRSINTILCDYANILWTYLCRDSLVMLGVFSRCDYMVDRGSITPWACLVLVLACTMHIAPLCN